MNPKFTCMRFRFATLLCHSTKDTTRRRSGLLAKWSSSIAIVGLFVLSLALLSSSLGAVPASSAYSTLSITTSNGATVCHDSLGGTWNKTTDTCSISGTLTVEEAITSLEEPTLNIGTGVTVNTSGGSDGIENYGAINNYGSLIGIGSTIGIYNYGTIDNAGTTVGSGKSYGIENYGTINNVGITFGISILNYGIINDYCGSYPGGTVTGSGSVVALSCKTVTTTLTETIQPTLLMETFPVKRSCSAQPSRNGQGF